MTTTVAPSASAKKFASVSRRVAAIALSLVIMAGISVTAASPSEAMTVKCAWPRCTFNLSKKETRDYANYGILPNFPSGTGLAQEAYYLVALAHRWFAIQYANRKQCVSFVLSAAPWERQGMYGRRC